MIKIQKLNKFYNKGKENEIHVINDVTLELPNSGLISFLGPSGSGKTTLLNVIGGLDKAKGHITYDGLSIENYNMHKVDTFRCKEVGYVFQNYNLLLEETVYSNLEIALEMIGIYDKAEQEKRIEYTLKAVGMYKYRKKRAYALSGGQQQRVSIARALVKKTKIIIADEPTGNLDSENTIEVMNILKKISETSLVLVVTHNEEVANFYSDQIIRIKDGTVSEVYKNDGKQSLRTEQTNTIYLRDLNVKEEKGELVTLKYYGTSNLKPLELRIIEKNGTYFISSDEKIKLLEETNLKVIDSHYQDLKQETIEQFNYDTSWYQEDRKKLNIIKRIGHALQISFNKMRFSKKRAKILYFAFFIIGVVLAICVIGFSNYYITDESNFQIDSSFNLLRTDEYASQNDYKKQYYNIIDSVEDLTSVTFTSITFKKMLNFSENFNFSTYVNAITYKGSENLKILAGSAPKKDEIVLSKKYADNFIHSMKQYYPTYESMIGLDFYVGSSLFTLSGIVDNKYALCYINDESFLSFLDDSVTSWKGREIRSFEIEKKYDTYDIIEGRDLTENDKETNNILISAPYKHLLGETIQYGVKEYNVVGVFDFKDYSCDERIEIAFEEIKDNFNYSIAESSYEYMDYKIVEGNYPTKNYECIVSIYSQYNVGDQFSTYDGNYTFTIVGRYISDNNTTAKYVLYSRDAVMLAHGFNQWFRVNDVEQANDTLGSKFYIQNLYTYYYNQVHQEQKINLLIFGILSLVLIITIAIFIYFIMRSRMISDIYPIGVYRSLGASRFKIILRFLSDILVIVTLTSLIGYFITTFIFDSIASNVNNTMSMNALKSSYLFSSLGVLILYVLNLFFGLFPIIMLMRKTPAEIISKYDI